jgi:aminopeptidase 2
VETEQLRAAVLAGLGALGGDERVLAKAVALVDSDLAGRDAGDPTVLDAAYLIAPLAGGSALYERILKSMPSARTPLDFYRRQKALAYFRDATLIDRTLAYALSSEVRNQDAALLMGTLLVNPAAEARAWTGIKGRWSEVKRKSDIAQGALQIVSSLQFCDRSMQQDVERFFQTHEAPGARRAIARAVETIGACAATKEAQQARLAHAIAGD